MNTSPGSPARISSSASCPPGASAPAHRIVEPEDPRQHLRGEAGRHRPRIGLPELGGELLALRQRDRRPVLGMDEQVVLGQEPGEQHPVPLLIGALPDQQLDRPTHVAQLPALRPQPAPQDPAPSSPRWAGARLDHPKRPSAARQPASAARRAAHTPRTPTPCADPTRGRLIVIEPSARGSASRRGWVEVVEALGAVGVLAAVLVPVDVELRAQDAGVDERDGC